MPETNEPQEGIEKDLNPMLSTTFVEAMVNDLNSEENAHVPISDGGEYIRASTVLRVFLDKDGKRNLEVVEQHIESVVPTGSIDADEAEE